MVNIPADPTTPLDPPPDFDLTVELQVQRDLTAWFIEADPIDIDLIPKSKETVPGGGFQLVDLPPRPSQRFHLIPMSFTERPVPSQGFSGSVTEQGAQSKFDFTLLGNWDATVKQNDWWTDERGQRWIVDSVIPYNGYEVKAMVMSYGKNASHGQA